LLHVPYQNPQSDDYTTDFRVMNGEVIYTVNIDHSKYIALLDTGSNVSLIHSNIFRKLPPSVYEIIPMENSRTASLANGNTMTLSQLVRVKLTIQGRTVFLEAFVSPDITYELIIGTNFFLQNNININFYTKTLHFVHTARLRMAHTITIQPYSIATVYTIFPQMPPGEVIFTPSEHWIQQGILIPKILFTFDSNKPYAPIKISNIA
jgi:predicted aspartyl protease